MRQDEYCSEIAEQLCEEDKPIAGINAAWIAMAIATYLRENRLEIEEVFGLRKALEQAKEFIENQQLPDAEWSRVLDICVKALRQG